MLKIKRSSFGVVAHLLGLPARVDELRRQLTKLTSLTQHEKGCISCELIENENDSGEFTLLEEWSSEEMHNIHFATGPIRNALQTLSNLLSSELGSRQLISRLNMVRYGANSYYLGVC